MSGGLSFGSTKCQYQSILEQQIQAGLACHSRTPSALAKRQTWSRTGSLNPRLASCSTRLLCATQLHQAAPPVVQHCLRTTAIDQPLLCTATRDPRTSAVWYPRPHCLRACAHLAQLGSFGADGTPELGQQWSLPRPQSASHPEVHGQARPAILAPIVSEPILTALSSARSAPRRPKR